MSFFEFIFLCLYLAVIVLIIWGLIRWVIRLFSPKNDTLESDKLDFPVFTTENIGRNYLALGMVKSSSVDEANGMKELQRQAIGMNADAIVAMQMNISNDTSGKVSSGFTGKHTSGRTSTKTTYHFMGTAVKFNESSNNE